MSSLSPMHLGIAIGVIVGLLIYWIWQRRSSGPSAEGS